MNMPTTHHAGQKQVQMAAKLYEMRDTAKVVLGDRYAEQMAQFGKVIQKLADQEGSSVLRAAIEMCKSPKLTPMDVVMVMAAAVELTEPSA